MTTTKKPTVITYSIITAEGTSAFWTRIGSVWPHKLDEEFDNKLTALPLCGRIVLMPPKEEEPDQAQ